MGSVLTGSDAERMQMMGEYASGCSMHKVASALNRSTATVTSHLHRDDNAVQRSGFCPLCKRTGGEHKFTKVLRREKMNMYPKPKLGGFLSILLE